MNINKASQFKKSTSKNGKEMYYATYNGGIRMFRVSKADYVLLQLSTNAKEISKFWFEN